MVTAVTNLGRSGLSDWLVQRVTAVVLFVYVLFICCVIFSGDLQYSEWKSLFDQTWVRVFSLAAMLSIAMHAWVGIWCISTDYIIDRFMGAKATVLRLLFQATCAIILFTYVVWGVQILWG
jgi:succinate dehydrogenase membrane anchor subunit